MDLFKLLGTISIKNSDANKALDETSNKGQQTEGKLNKVFSGIGKGAAVVGKAVGAGMVAAGTAVVGLVTKSVQAYSEYEQLVGGVDTLFKDSSAKVQAYAEKAYETAGMSANEYMNTVTSFSASLLQSLGGDTEKAADKANVAITDMADNANKMGTSMESIQNAYQGFAKQNYTMLDNLKLGYGGTKEEMERLLADAEKLSGQKFDISSYADVVDAIHVVQTEMGITGTTAQEAAGTISGSMASVKGAWTNLVTAMSSDKLPLDEYITKFVDSASVMVDNMMPKIQQALVGVVQLINQLAPVIIGKIPELLSQLLPAVIQAATGIVNAFAMILPDAIASIVNMAPMLVNAFVLVVNSIIEALPNAIQAIVSALPTLITTLVDGIFSIWNTIMANIMPIVQPIIDAIPSVVISLVEAIKNNLPAFIQGIVSLVSSIIEALPTIVQSLVDAIPTIVQLLCDALVENLPIIIDAILVLTSSILEMLPTIIESLVGAIPTVVQMLSDALQECLPQLIDGIIALVFMIVDNLPTIIQALVDAIPVIISSIISAILENLPEIIVGLVKVVGALVIALPQIFGELIRAIPKIFRSICDGIWDGIISGLSGIGNWFGEKFTDAKNKSVSAFSDIKDKLAEPFNKAKDKIKEVADKIKGFFKGEISMPKIKTPKFSITPKGWKIGDLLDGVIPKLSIKWNAKGAIMKEPTLFGYNPATGTFQGGGEAGDEAVAPIDTLQQYVKAAVQSENTVMVSKLDRIIELLVRFFPEMLGALDINMYLDTGVLVAETAGQYDVALGKIAIKKGRGR